MSKFPLNDESDLVPSTPEDSSDNDVYETLAAHSFNKYSKSNVKASAVSRTEKIEESVQGEDSDSYSVEGEEEEESQHSSRPGSSDDEEPEDEVDQSRSSNLVVSPFGTKKGSKQKAHRFLESSEDESDDESDENVSYHVRGKRLGSSEKYSTSQIGDLDESYQVIQAERRQAKLVIRSCGENSAETSDIEGLEIQKANASDSSDESAEDSFAISVKKKPTRNLIDSDSDSSGPPVTSACHMFADNAGKELYKKTETGYISVNDRREADSITMDSIANLHLSLDSCPKETDVESTPACLTVPLLAHQERALKWLLWRETQIPAGGILADDMGLGKILTMIALIVKQKELDPPPPASSDIWLSKTIKIKRSSGTLVVCPTSVVGQWEKEIQRRCKQNSLSTAFFHGPDRNKLASKLHQYDVVITTYQIVSREIANVSLDKKDGDSKPIGDFDVETDAKAKSQSVLLQIAFDRIILDEAHVIRNPKAGISKSVCRLRAFRRWVVTGTPVQKKELGMYSLLRFLRVTPFDQLAVWKRWVDSSKNKNEETQGLLQLLIKTLLLRRTKDQKVEGSEPPLVAMPTREVHAHKVELSQEENEVYQKLLAFSRKALEEYIKNQENKIKEGYGFTYDRRNVTKQMILVLLLRLRQACSHPALIQIMLDATDSESMGSEDAKIEENDLDLISQMSTMTLDNKPGEPKKEEADFFTHTNPVFDRDNMSSKMRYITEEVRKVVSQNQKAVVVSQWTSMLDLFSQHFQRMRIRCHLIAGSVPIKQRTQIVEDFNGNPGGAPVILLSLGAGGVGLNLIGGNHIFIADMHWNPQLEAQACDRVYRVGQTKDVHVHRMITQGTVEERILQLQQEKLAMANGILTGAAKLATKGLTIDDLKMLFNPGPPAYVSKPMVKTP